MAQKKEAPKIRKAHFYWWTLANTLAACLAILSWVLCLHIFGHPEIPRNYELLKKLGVADAPVGFELTDAPPGEAANPLALYRRYAQLDEAAMSRLNSALMRNYLTDLDIPDLLQYVEGDFKIIEVREFTPDDLFHPGFAVHAEAMVRPDEFSEAAPWPVRIEYLVPTASPNISGKPSPDEMLSVSKVPNCGLLLHVAREDGGDTPVVILSVVPIAIGEHPIGEQQQVEVCAPTDLNPAAHFPVFRHESDRQPDE